jgi:hypothetical protein
VVGLAGAGDRARDRGDRVWGAWVAPKAKRRLPDPLRLLVELAILALATVAFAELGQTALAIVFAVAATTTAGLSRRCPAP